MYKNKIFQINFKVHFNENSTTFVSRFDNKFFNRPKDVQSLFYLTVSYRNLSHEECVKRRLDMDSPDSSEDFQGRLLHQGEN